MVREPIKKKRHLIALVFTLLAFLIGITLGSLITKERIESATEISQEQRLEAESIQLQYLYISSQLKDQNCPAILKTLEENLAALERARIKLENFIIQNREKEYVLIKRDYTLAEMRYWLLLKQTEDICPNDSIPILYFYSDEENCADCPLQGLLLTTIKEKVGSKVLIFSIDAAMQDEVMVDIIKDSFDIKKLPTIIIEDEKVEGFTLLEDLYKVLCAKYAFTPEICKEYANS